ncbi:unnamed protein product [Vitrella brassicaformis CCMP3155]|uniref:Uncharacterized protein n=1 Tax=Vitrella brassicaformis (strain CCMP3155) TaxID=1169540 RepID=A0A0G4FD18_VITBC|nr:unnamed protein product [Vitrella brassicaformis CCMP3155]|eukprot:CEM10738.1 unnamed protein product [Vitrella brassicaformis CCMP3155]
MSLIFWILPVLLLLSRCAALQHAKVLHSKSLFAKAQGKINDTTGTDGRWKQAPGDFHSAVQGMTGAFEGDRPSQVWQGDGWLVDGERVGNTCTLPRCMVECIQSVSCLESMCSSPTYKCKDSDYNTPYDRCCKRSSAPAVPASTAPPTPTRPPPSPSAGPIVTAPPVVDKAPPAVTTAAPLVIGIGGTRTGGGRPIHRALSKRMGHLEPLQVEGRRGRMVNNG